MGKEYGALKRIENGCFGCLILVTMIGLTIVVWFFAAQLFSYNSLFSFLQIWTATALVLLPVVFLGFFYFGWRLMPEKPYVAPLSVDPESDKSLLAKTSEKLILLWLGVIIFLVMVGIILVGLVIHWEQGVLNIWALVSTFGLTLAALSGFAAGGIYMEDYRKSVLLFGGILLLGLGFLFFGLPHLTQGTEFTPRYLGGVLTGLLISLATWRYLSRRWDPALMATVYESPMDAFISYSSVGQLIFFLVLMSLSIAMPLFEDIALPCLGVWILLTFGYMMARVFWNRPRRFDI